MDTTYFEKCIRTLDKAFGLLLSAKPESLEYELYRSASIKEFEIILEQSGKLLKKALKPYFHSTRSVDQLYFKDIFRNAVKFQIIDDEACGRWLNYRDNRNNTAHDYGVNFSEETIVLLPLFIKDAKMLAEAIKSQPEE